MARGDGTRAGVLITALLMVGAAAPARAQSEPTRDADVPGLGLTEAGTVRITPEADHVLLGRDPGVGVVLEFRDARGGLVDALDVGLRASTGRAGKAERVGPGRYRAPWLAPPERFPHVVMMMATGKVPGGRVVGTAILPLWGQGRLHVDTKPQAQVLVRVGEVPFGPVTANSRGVAWIDVQAPPGPTRAIAESVDRAGNESTQAVDLGVPPFNRLALFPLDAPAPGGPAAFLVMAVDGRGGPVAEAPLDVEAEGGTAGEPELVRAGTWFWHPVAPVAAPGTSWLVKVGLRGHAGSAAVATTRIAHGPARKGVVLPRAQHVLLELTDEHGFPARTTRVAVIVGERPPTLVEVPPGRTARVDVPGQAGGRLEDPTGRELARWDAEEVTSIPAAVAVTVGPVVLADQSYYPRDARAFVVTARDAAGRALPGVPLALRSGDRVQVLARRARPDGTVQFVVRPAPSAASGPAMVQVQTEGGQSVPVEIPRTLISAPRLRLAMEARAAWNGGRVAYSGAWLGTDLHLPLPIPGSVRWELVMGASATPLAGLPLRLFSTRPFAQDRWALVTSSGVTGGVEIRLHRVSLAAVTGPALAWSHVTNVGRHQSPVALLPLAALVRPQLGHSQVVTALAPGWSARLTAGVGVGPGTAQLSVGGEGWLRWGGPIRSMPGLLFVGAGYGWSL